MNSSSFGFEIAQEFARIALADGPGIPQALALRAVPGNAVGSADLLLFYKVFDKLYCRYTVFNMPRKAVPRLRQVTINAKRFWQISIPQPQDGRRLRTFKDKVTAQQFFAAVQKEFERLDSTMIEAEARAMVLGTAPVFGKRTPKSLR